MSHIFFLLQIYEKSCKLQQFFLFDSVVCQFFDVVACKNGSDSMSAFTQTSRMCVRTNHLSHPHPYPHPAWDEAPQCYEHSVFPVYRHHRLPVLYGPHYESCHILCPELHRIVASCYQVGLHEPRPYVRDAYWQVLHPGQLVQAFQIVLLKTLRSRIRRRSPQPPCPRNRRDTGNMPP